MKKILAIVALVAIVAFGAFASSTVTVGAGGVGYFDSSVYLLGPAVKLFTTSGNTFNDLTVESPMWVKNIDSFDDVSEVIHIDIHDADIKFLQLIRASETFGLALNLLGDSGPVTLTVGVGGNVSMDGLFVDSKNRLLEFRAGAGAVVDLGIAIARPLAVVVGVSANYPLFGLKVITENGSTSTDSYSIKDAHFETAAHVGIGLSF